MGESSVRTKDTMELEIRSPTDPRRVLPTACYIPLDAL